MLLFSKDELNWSKLTVKTEINKCCLLDSTENPEKKGNFFYKSFVNEMSFWAAHHIIIDSFMPQQKKIAF